MNAITACRALLCGATLFAATAMAAPDAAHPARLSPCLSPPPATAATQAPQSPPPARHQWRGPCYLADAGKANEEYANEGESAKEARQRVDEIMWLTRPDTSRQEEHQLAWQALEVAAHHAEWQPQAMGGPSGWMLPQNPMYRADEDAPRYQNEGGIPAVPEPGTVFMLITGLILIGGAMRRQRTPPFTDDTAPPAARL